MIVVKELMVDLQSIREEKINLLNKLTEKLNISIVRISSLSDPILLEQEREEYEEINNKIIELNNYMEELDNKIIIDSITLNTAEYELCSLDNYISINYIKEKRLKNINHTTNRRELKIISDAIGKIIIIKNLYGNVVDIIGYNNVKLPLSDYNLILYCDTNGNLIKIL